MDVANVEVSLNPFDEVAVELAMRLTEKARAPSVEACGAVYRARCGLISQN